MKNFLLTILLIGILKPIFPVFEYVLNYDVIVAELCEKRDLKDSGCDGKCYLRKQLAKVSDVEKNTSSPSEKKISPTFEILFFDDYVFQMPQITFVVESHFILDFYKNDYKHLISSSDFKPPLC